MVLVLGEDMVLALEKDVVMALEEDVAQKEGPWGSRDFGHRPQYLHGQGLEFLLHLVDPALEEKTV